MDLADALVGIQLAWDWSGGRLDFWLTFQWSRYATTEYCIISSLN